MLLILTSAGASWMADPGDSDRTRVFLSYARVDQPRVAKLAAALEARGITLWWDRALEGGSAFADVIEAELKRCDACIVAWSKAAATSHWVRDEAGWARDHGRLVPVLLDITEPPLGFRQIQGIDLAHWNGRADAPEIDALHSALLSALGRAVPATTGTNARHTARRLPVPALAALVVAALAVLGFLGWREFSAPEPSTPAVTAAAPESPAAIAEAVAVLPFADLSQERDQAYFADGVAEEITMRLARDGRLKVVGRTTAAAIRDRASDLGYVRGTLGVGHLLEGSVRESGGRLRIAVRLINTKDGGQQWSETYDRQSGDIFAVQDEVAVAVVQRLAANLAAPAGRASADATHQTSPENYRKYLLGRSLMRERTKSSADRAAELFAEVMQADSDYAPAFAAFAFATGLREAWGDLAKAEFLRLAQPAIDRALALDPNLAEAWLAQARLFDTSDRREEMAAAARRAVKLDPDNAEVLGPASHILRNSYSPGALEEAFGYANRAVALDPLFLQAQMSLQWRASAVGDEATARRALVAFDKAATRREDFDRLQLNYASIFRPPADFIQRYRAKKSGANLEWEVGTYRGRLGMLFDRATLAAELRRDGDGALLRDLMGDWDGVLRALDGPEREEFGQAQQVFIATRAFRELGRFGDLVHFVTARHPLPWAPTGYESNVLSALAVVQALRKTGEPAAAAPYIAYARTNLARMRADAYAPAAFAQAEAALALADGDRAAALRHLELSAAQPSGLNICYGPVWIGTSPAWEDLRSEPDFARLVTQCRNLVNSQRAEIGLPPADLP